MPYRIWTDTDYIHHCAQRIRGASDRLSAAGGKLSGGGTVRGFRLKGSVHLGYVGMSVTHSGVSDTLAAYRRALARCAAKGQELGRGFQTAGNILASADEKLRAAMLGEPSQETTENGNSQGSSSPFDLIDELFPTFLFPTIPWLDYLPSIADFIIHGVTLEDIINKVKDDAQNWIQSLTNVSGEGQIDGALFHAEGETDNAYYDVDIGQYHGEYSYNAGLTSIDADGNLIFNPYLNFAAGMGFTMLTADAGVHGEIMPGVSGAANASVTLGQVEANCNASAGLLDASGNFNPHLDAGFNVEAIAAEVTVDGSISALGVTTEIEGGFNIGVGAHGDVSIGDGVITADLGLSFGLGVDIKLTIDYGEAIDAVTGYCESAMDFVGDTFSGLADIGSDVGNALFGWMF